MADVDADHQGLVDGQRRSLALGEGSPHCPGKGKPLPNLAKRLPSPRISDRWPLMRPGDGRARKKGKGKKERKKKERKKVEEILKFN